MVNEVKLKMTIDDALAFADEWSRGMTIHEDSRDWRVVCMLLAKEVRNSRAATGEPKKNEIAARLRNLADEMAVIAVAMDFYAGSAEWGLHSRELAGAGEIARQWAEEIEAYNA